MTLNEFIVKMVELRNEGHGELQVYLGHHCSSSCDQIFWDAEPYSRRGETEYLRLEGAYVDCD